MEQANILYDLGYYEIIVFILFIYLFHLLYQKIGFVKQTQAVYLNRKE